MATNLSELEKRIVECNDAYFNGTPLVTDSQFEEMLEELRGIDPAHVLLKVVGSTPSYGKKIKHPEVMGSLEKEKTYSGIVERLQNWIISITPDKHFIDIVQSWKLDGLSLRLTYHNGVLVEAVTRGDGYEGQDVTDNVKYIPNIPQRIKDNTGYVEFRGEVVMPISVWNANGRVFANPRNGAAGVLLQKDPKETGKHTLKFIAYDVRSSQMFVDEQDKRDFTLMKGLEYIDFTVFRNITRENPITEADLEALDKKRELLDFGTDGIVFSIAYQDHQNQLGYNGPFPKFKFAYKFPAKRGLSKVNGIEWTTSRTGMVAPVLLIEPTPLDGSVISRISLHSFNRVKELALSVGDDVLIEKANDIIPQVVRVEGKNGGEPLLVPLACPSCKSFLEIDGAHIFCLNELCDSKRIYRILHWVETIGLDGIGEGVITSLCETGAINSIRDLYFLNEEQVKKVTGGEASAKKIVNEIMSRSEVHLSKFIEGLGSHKLGKTYGKKLAENINDVPELLSTSLASLIDLTGNVVGTAFYEFLKANEAEIKELNEILTIINPKIVGVLSGKKFVLTGTMSRGRKEIVADIESKGGKVCDSINKEVDYLVQNGTSSSAKSVKAKSLGIDVITEEKLMEMFNG